MQFVSTIQKTAPTIFETPLQAKVYTALAELHIPFFRVDTDEVITMTDCIQINEKLDMKMVKTLFLSNRQQTEFYLLITAGDKPFRAREFSNALGVSRFSFAPVEKMEGMLGTKIGAATIFSAMLDEARNVRIVIDKDVTEGAWYGCSDGTTRGYLKISTADILEKFLPSIQCKPAIVAI